LERDSSFPAETADVLSSDSDALAGVTVIVCASCRDETGSDTHPRAGELLAEDTRGAASGENVRIRSVECLGNCKRRLSAAILREGCWSYVFGDLTATSGADLVAGAKLFATSTDGLIPWRGRPDCLKRGLVARIPPLDLLKDLT
jgi:predicted metal-binding protein